MSDKLTAPVKKRTVLQKKRFIIPAVALLVLGCIFGLYYCFYAFSHISTDDAFIEGHAISISPKVSGHILKVYIDDNQQAYGTLAIESPHI